MIKKKSSTRTPRSKTPAVVSLDDAQAWATRINHQLGLNRQHRDAYIEGVLTTGRELLSAKTTLGHGNWGRMFASHPEAVPEPLDISIDTAERYMAIALDPVLSDSAHVRSLPTSYSTLAELARVPYEIKQKALTDGRIHPEMERKEVARLRAPRPARGPWAKPPAPSASFQSLRRTLMECVSDCWDTLTLHDQEQVLALLARLHRECRAKFDRATVARYQATAGATYTEAPADATKKEAR
jgi:hypothetical protein